jgi:hypothetical protein
MVQGAAIASAIDNAESTLKVSEAATQAPAGLSSLSSPLLANDVLWSALRAKKELQGRGEPLLAPGSSQLDVTKQADAEAYLESAGAARVEPVVTHVQLFFILGVALVTMQLDLNAAVISFTLLFHLCRLAHRLEWTTIYLEDMRLDSSAEDANGKNNRRSKAAISIGVGDWVRLKATSGSDAAAVGIVKSFDLVSGRYTVIRQQLPASANSNGGGGDSESTMKTQLLDDSQEVAIDSSGGEGSDGPIRDIGAYGMFTALAAELSLVDMPGDGNARRSTSRGSGGDDSGLSEPLLGPGADGNDDYGDDEIVAENNCWIVLCGKCASWCRSIAKEEVERERRRSSINMLDGDGAGTEVRIARKGTVAGSIFNLCNCMLGVGVLALPSSFSRVGVVLGLVLLFSCAVRTPLSRGAIFGLYTTSEGMLFD